ncbi:MAG: ATP-binding protein, partial [Gemmataceae bacterium]|nr:ATP-binding protein [Gemmataceae bacterium]
MKFLILRVLTHSELGMFHEYRRQGKEGSRQRAINFDGDVVDRVFPTAHDTDRIALELRYDTDAGVKTLTHYLTRQAKNWRLENNCPRDTLYRFVDPGCLFALEVDAGHTPATGAWVVFPADSGVTQTVLADGSTGNLARAGMIALHGREAEAVRRILHAARHDMFEAAPGGPEPAMNDTTNRVEGGKHLPPRPLRTAEILGNTGHTFVSAVADIVDNAISADATEISITFAPPDGGHGRWMTITDNGHGMTEAELDEAMTLGSEGQYEDNSLGKYGFGLKGASWSQAEVFTVVTRRRGEAQHHLSWDQKNLGNWVALTAPLEAWEAEATRLGEQGTSILWKNMKPPQQTATARGVPPYFQEIVDLQRHLGLVFHRFLEGAAKNRKKVSILINDVAVAPNNPVGHTLTIEHDVKTVKVPLEDGDATVQIQPFLLPSEDELKHHHRDEGQDAINQALGRIGIWGKRTETQGMFIYRNDRLIKYGGWDGIWTTRDEKTKHARITVDFGKKLDRLFDINITKMSVNLSARVLDEVKRLATPLRNASRRKFSVADRTPPTTPTPPPSPPINGPGAGPGPTGPSSGPTGPTTTPPAGPAPPTGPLAPPLPPPVTVRTVETGKF